MTVTPQTNTTLPAIAKALLEHDSFVIGGHMNPDGDCLGSQLALAHALRACGKQVTVVQAIREQLSAELMFLPGADEIICACDYTGPVEVFVTVDAPKPDRIGDADELRRRAAFTVTVDHHAVPEAMSTLSYTDPDAASTSMLVWELIGYLGCERTATMATCAYTGLVTDTGRFAYQNTDVAAFRSAISMIEAGADPAYVAKCVYQNNTLASILLEIKAIDHMELLCDGTVALSYLAEADFEACNALKADAEHIIDVLRSIAGVEIACVLRDKGSEVRGSFRAKNDFDVSALARELGGGGHRAAAGFTFHGTMEEAVVRLRGLLVERYGAHRS